MMHLSWGYLSNVYRLKEKLMDTSPDKKDSGVLVDEKLEISQQYPGLVRVPAGWKKWLSPPTLAFWGPIWYTAPWGTQYKKDMVLLERVQKSAIKMRAGVPLIWRKVEVSEVV